VPFSLDDLATGDEIDGSATWENVVGFLPNPSELFRLDALSYIASNTIYNVRTQDVLGYKTRGLYHAVAYNFIPFVDAGTGQLLYIERRLGTGIERYKPDDKRLVRMWRLDHTTEVLPSKNTIAQAIMQAAGEVYYADLWIKHFYERGGIAPTVIAMKGAIAPDKKNTEEQSWSDWLRGLGKYAGARIARVFNADTLTVQQFGSAVTDLKNNDVYRQAIENIAMGVGMPLSLLLSNSANMATATIEERQWYKTTITPFITWLAYEYNEQVFHPIGIHLKFNTATMDAQQEEDAQNAATAKLVLDLVKECPTFEIFEAVSSSYLEVSDELLKAAKQYYADKKANAAIVVQQTQPKDTETVTAQAEEIPKELPAPEPQPPAKWIPSLDNIRELQRWQELAFRKFKRDEPLDFEWRNDTLPDEIYNTIKASLPNAKEENAIKDIFDMAQFADTPPVDNDPIKLLAKSLDKYAEALFANRNAIPTT
jgi:hypothetical protein